MGDDEQARIHINAVIDSYHHLPRTGSYQDAMELASLALAYALNGENEKALAAARESREMVSEEDDTFTGAGISEINAQVLGMTGNREESLAEIERLLEYPTGFNRWEIYLDPRWDFFRDDERFNELVRPLNLAEVQQ